MHIYPFITRKHMVNTAEAAQCLTSYFIDRKYFYLYLALHQNTQTIKTFMRKVFLFRTIKILLNPNHSSTLQSNQKNTFRMNNQSSINKNASLYPS